MLSESYQLVGVYNEKLKCSNLIIKQHQSLICQIITRYGTIVFTM